MDTENNFGRLLSLLLLTLVICLALYHMPEKIAGHTLKKVDLLSDLRIKSPTIVWDDFFAELEREDSLFMDSVSFIPPIEITHTIDSVSLALRDSLYRVMYTQDGADSLGIHIEDYSLGHTGLKRFFATLKNVNSLDRPVRIAFMGDSFIEGDIIVADFRDAMQKRFGGGGVGFVPVTSAAAQFRPTIDQKVKGWDSYSMTKNKECCYVLPGMYFEVKGNEASLSFKTVDRYKALKHVSSVKFLYHQNPGVNMQFVCNGSSDTLRTTLPSSSAISQYEWKQDSIVSGSFTFSDAQGFRALGIALEQEKGIIVDNYSLRGNSGFLLQYLNPDDCRDFHKIRPYDLLILQYGLNAVDESMLQYSWYRSRMIEVIAHVRECFPDTDILLLGVSDKSYQGENGYETMPAVLAMLHTQRQIARQTGTPFWNVLGAMGGENSMVRYVENNWASKDYTHLSFRGGREIANAFMNTLMLEKEFYDEAEKSFY